LREGEGGATGCGGATFRLMRLLQPGPPLVIGHRGAAAVLPENTLPSIAHALALGVDALEFDVRVTRDGVAMVHHDPTTARTGGESLSIKASTAADLRTIDANAVMRAPGLVNAVRIPTLDEVLELTAGVPVIIECKTVEAAPAVLAALARHGAAERALIGSFVHGAIRVVREAGRPHSASRTDMISLVLRTLVRIAPRQVPYQAMCLPPSHAGLTLPMAQLAQWGRRAGVAVHVWTVNQPAEAHRFWRLGVTGILTDDPAAILAARDGLAA
jgi:glycerophosphoryl diester phosphodiesterase